MGVVLFDSEVASVDVEAATGMEESFNPMKKASMDVEKSFNHRKAPTGVWKSFNRQMRELQTIEKASIDMKKASNSGKSFNRSKKSFDLSLKKLQPRGQGCARTSVDGEERRTTRGEGVGCCDERRRQGEDAGARGAGGRRRAWRRLVGTEVEDEVKEG